MTSRQKHTTTSIVAKFQEVQGDKYDYSRVSYKTMHTKVDILCKIHGIFSQTPNAHIRQNQGCPKCSNDLLHNKQRSTTEDFIKKSIEINGSRYIYTKTIYGKNASEEVVITCRIHGDFKVRPNGHLSKKSNCIKCSKITGVRKLKKKDNLGWNRSSWIKRLEGKTAKLYILECFDEKERFLKIGITSKNVKRRYSGGKVLPYEYKVLHLIESTDAGYIYDLEHKILQQTVEDRYEPMKPFVGSRLECRNLVDITKLLCNN